MVDFWRPLLLKVLFLQDSRNNYDLEYREYLQGLAEAIGGDYDEEGDENDNENR